MQTSQMSHCACEKNASHESGVISAEGEEREYPPDIHRRVVGLGVNPIKTHFLRLLFSNLSFVILTPNAEILPTALNSYLCHTSSLLDCLGRT